MRKVGYKSLGLRYHPDKNAENNKEIAGEIFGLLNDAYQTLINPARRTQYDNLEKNGLGNLPQQSEYKGKASFTIAKPDAAHSLSMSDNFTVFPNKGKIHLCNNRTGGDFKKYSRSHKYEVYYGCTISEEENKIFAAHSSGDIDVFDIATGERTECYQAVNKFSSGGSGVIRLNNDQLLAYDDKKATILTRSNNNRMTIPLDNLNDVTLSADKQFFVASSSDMSVKIIHLGTKRVIDELPTDFYVYTAQMSPDSKWLAYGGNKNQK